MITWLSLHAAPLVTVSALVFSTFVVLSRDTARHRRLMRNLELASEMIDLHMKALESFTSDERAPLQLRQKLLAFSESIFDEQIFPKVFDRACQLKPHEYDASSFRKERGQLLSVDPQLDSLFTTAISSAIVAMVLKTQGATVKLDDALARLATIEEEKTFIYMRVSRTDRVIPISSGSMLAGAA